MTYSIVLLRRADGDFHSIVYWLKKRSFRGAEHWRFALDDCLSEIARDPFRYERVTEEARSAYRIRQVLFHTRHGNTYRIIFLVEQSRSASCEFEHPDNVDCGHEISLTNENHMTKLHLAINGAAGRMGKRLIALGSADPELQIVVCPRACPTSPISAAMRARWRASRRSA